MKLKVLHRNTNDYVANSPGQRNMEFRSHDKSLHPFQFVREHKRAVTAAKLERIFAKPFHASLSGHTDTVTCLSRSPVSVESLVSGSANGELRFWNLGSKHCLRRIPNAHEGIIQSICCDDEYLFSGGRDWKIQQWALPQRGVEESSDYMVDYDLVGGEIRDDENPLYRNRDIYQKEAIVKPIQTILTNSVVSSLDHNSFQPTLASTGEAVWIWDQNRGSSIGKYSWGYDQYYHCKWSPSESNLLLVTTNSNAIVLVDLRQSDIVQKTVLEMRSNACSWNPMVPFNFSLANDDQNCYTFDIRHFGKAVNCHIGFTAAATCIDYSPNGREFSSGSMDKTVRIWETHNRMSREVYYTKRQQLISSLTVTGDGKFILTGSSDMNIRVWKTNASEILGPVSRKTQQSINYREALKNKFKAFPEVSNILRQRRLPREVKKNLIALKAAREKESTKQHNRDAKGGAELSHHVDLDITSRIVRKVEISENQSPAFHENRQQNPKVSTDDLELGLQEEEPEHIWQDDSANKEVHKIEKAKRSRKELLNGDLSAKPVGNSIDDDPDLLYGEKFEDAPENTLDALKMAAEPIDSTDASEPNDEDMELLKNLMLSPYIYDMYFMLGLEKVPVYETLHSFHVNEIEKLRITDNRILSSQGGIYAEKITLSEQPIEIHMGTRVGSLFHHPNQDRVATYPCVDEDGFFVGLFDGHGRGAEDLVVPSIDWLGNTTTDKCRDDLGNLLIQLDKLIWKNADQLGSTGTLVLVKPAENRVVVQSANWGDSEAGILSVDSNGRHVLEMLTVSDNVVEKVSRIRVFERLLLDGFTAYVINPQDNKIKEIHTTKEFIDFDTKPNTFKFMKSKTAATKPLAATKPEDDFPVVVELLENYWGVEHTNGMLQSRQSLGDKSLMQVTPYWLDTPNKGALDLLRQPDTTSYVIVGSDGFWGALANGIKYEGKIVNEGIVAPSMDQYLSSLLGQESPHLFMRFNASLELPWQDRFLSNVMLLCRSQTDDCTYHITKIPNYSLEFPSSDQENN